MGKRKRTEERGKPCCTRFKLNEIGNCELSYDGKRLHSAPGRRLRAKAKAPEGVVDRNMFGALGIENKHTINALEAVVNWAAEMWPELKWEDKKLPYKVVKDHANALIVLQVVFFFHRLQKPAPTTVSQFVGR